MLPLTPPDFFAQTSLGRFALSALPDAPVRPHSPRRHVRLAARLSRGLRPSDPRRGR